ncbi:MAG: peroxiredoxin [Pseudomonadales bacterium]|jgi:peroxiredoxin Q/BCP
MLNVGDQAPEIDTVDHLGRPQKLSDLLRSGPVVLYFYPADFSPVCTAQACAFRDTSGALDAASVHILGISPQSAASHKRFADAFGLDFPLLSDTTKAIIRAYGVDGPLGFGVRRATFLVEQDGRIGRRVVSDLFVGSHKDFIAAILKDRENAT